MGYQVEPLDAVFSLQEIPVYVTVVSNIRNVRKGMGHLIAKIGLAPVYFAQGKYVRANIEMLPEPLGAREGVAGNGPPLRLLVLGDSAAAGVGAGSQEEALLGALLDRLSSRFAVHYRLEATTGYKTADALQRVFGMNEEGYDVVLTSLGVNDVTSASTRRGFLSRQTRLIDILRQKFSARQIVISALPPMGDFPALPQPLRWYLGFESIRFNRGLKALAEEQGCDFIEFEFSGDSSGIASDGFHPGPPVYQHWAELAADKIIHKFDG